MNVLSVLALTSVWAVPIRRHCAGRSATFIERNGSSINFLEMMPIVFNRFDKLVSHRLLEQQLPYLDFENGHASCANLEGEKGHVVTAMNAQSLETAMALFEPGASFVIKPGVVVSGTAGIRQALEGFMTLKPTLTIESQQIVQAGDVAQFCARWSLKGIDPTGTAVQLGGRSSSILRRQSDGRWLFLVDNPWGTDIVA